MELILVLLRQLIATYIGSIILYGYYRIRKKEISFKQILSETDEFGMKKYGIISFYIGLVFIIFTLLLFIKIVRG